MGRNFGERPRQGVPPPPGSPTARSLGCVCPQQRNLDLDREATNRRRRLRVVASCCPLHGWEDGPPPVPLKRAWVLEVLRSALPGLKKDFLVVGLWIFGSVARDEAGHDSDLDVLAEFAGSADLFVYTGLLHRLKELLGTPVDLGTVKSLRPTIRPRVMAERIQVE